MNLLRTGAVNEWTRATISIDATTGVASCVSMSNSSDGTGCPNPFDLTFTIDPTGVIAQTGDNAADVGNHMTMTSNKNFMAGTGTTHTLGFSQNKNSIGGTSPSNVPGSYQLAIAQKVVPGTAYGNVDLRNKSFAFHGMSVGYANGWAYGTASTDNAGVISIVTSEVSDGSVVSLPDGFTLSVNSSGIVTVSGVPSFQGFLSDDRKTIVGTFSGGNSYQMVIIQILGQTFPADTMLGQMAAGHSLATGESGPFWATFKVGSVNGTLYFYNWNTSNLMPAPSSGYYNATVTLTGTVTLDEDTSYNGQISHDGLFQVSTQTQDFSEFLSQNQPNIVSSPSYILSVATKPGLQKLPK